LREWRDLWPGGLSDEQYSTLNLMAYCREGSLGYNHARCQGCRHREWYASSCGDRHCPNCLGPRQAEWSEKVCERIPDCPHFHVVFTVPEELHDFFEANYRIAADELFGAAAETLKLFQQNNWKVEGGFLGVLHTWGRALNWHPHLHVLVSAGGRDLTSGQWRQVRDNYLFPVRSMSRVFGAIFLRHIEALDARADVRWPAELATVEARHCWRLKLAGRNWNIFSRATLGNTRAVVRYLARYTSRIAMSNQRIKRIDEEQRTVSFEWKDYKDGEKIKEMTMSGAKFLRAFTRHMVPKRFRRVRYFGFLVGAKNRHREVPGAPAASIGENACHKEHPACKNCGGHDWRYLRFYSCPEERSTKRSKIAAPLIVERVDRFSLSPRLTRPPPRPTRG
jgi:Putative transposase/Transposase zinc-binding domain